MVEVIEFLGLPGLIILFMVVIGYIFDKDLE